MTALRGEPTSACSPAGGAPRPAPPPRAPHRQDDGPELPAGVAQAGEQGGDHSSTFPIARSQIRPRNQLATA
jgi:hypothetical protein